MENGYIKVHRSFLNWGWYSDANTSRVFLHLLLNASWRCCEYKGCKLNAGDVVVGRKALAEQLGLTEQQVRTALNHLKSTKEITVKSTNKFSVVTIANWASYQLCDEGVTNEQPTNNQQTTNKQPTNNQQVTTYEESKKVRSKKVRSNNIGFTPPTLEEVNDYCFSRMNNIDGQAFIDYYKARGWKLNKGVPMKDWKATVRTWEKNHKKDKAEKGGLRF